jgi:NDP-sugar pyrophosphorylase family protein
MITAFLEKKFKTNAGWINAGISRMNTNFFKKWDGQPFSLEDIFYPKLVIKGGLRAIPIDADFIDIGIQQDYARFCRLIESGSTIRH